MLGLRHKQRIKGKMGEMLQCGTRTRHKFRGEHGIELGGKYKATSYFELERVNVRYDEASCRTLINMEEQDTEIARKRKMNNMEHETDDDTCEANEETQEEDNEMNFSRSEEMKPGISRVLEKVEAFNQLVSKQLELGKSLFKKLNQEFKERVLMIHKEQIEKWQEEIKELRMIDSTSKEMNARLYNAKCLLQTVHISQ